MWDALKRTCTGCRASNLMGLPYYRCELGYKVDKMKGRPLEECPKPKTYDELIKLPRKD